MEIHLRLTIDDRIARGMKKVMRKRVLLPVVGMGLLMIAGSLYAIDRTKYADGQKLTGTLMQAVIDAVNTNTDKLAPVTLSSSNLGINQTSPAAALDIKGLGNTSSTAALNVTNSNGITSILEVENGGRVGILTNSPITTLDVAGSTNITGTLAVGGATTLSSTLAVTGATTLSSTLAVTGASTLTGDVTASGTLTASSGMTMPRLSGLSIYYLTSNSISLNADYVTVFNSSNLGIVLSSVGSTVSISSSGANGLESGSSDAANTWYYIWVIYNGSTKAGLLSTSATSPTMPSGYTFKRLVGAVRNDASGDFISFRQYGDSVAVVSTAVLTAGSSTTRTSVDLSTIVPAIARSVTLHGLVATDGTSTASYVGELFSTSLLNVGYNAIGANVGTASTSAYVYFNVVQMLDKSNSSPVIYYNVGDSYNDLTIRVNGYTLDL